MSLNLDIEKSFDDFKLELKLNTTSKRIAILGASGCGKSLTLKSIAGIVRPDKGFVSVDDKVFFNEKIKVDLPPQDRNTGYLFQNYALFPQMTVAENIMIGMKCSKVEKKKLLEKQLERFSLKGLENHRPHELSGGQQQRVALARIMAYAPDIILLDEPFSALDAHLKDGLRLELKKTFDDFSGTSVIVTHDRDEAFWFCDTLVLMDKGRVIAFGDVKDLFDNPGTVTAARLTGVKNISRIERIDKHTAYALDWGNVKISTEDIIENDISYIGIRAHDLAPTDGLASTNCFPVNGASVVEMPFEWHITLKCGVWWKIEKSLHNHIVENMMPRYLSVDSSSIILLKGD